MRSPWAAAGTKWGCTFCRCPGLYPRGRRRRRATQTDDAVRIHGVGGDPPSGCRSAAAAPKVAEAVALTGGRFVSICQSGETIVQSVAKGVLAPEPGVIDGRLPLPDRPVVETIEVRVDGAAIASDAWTWESRGRVVVLEPDARPRTGSTVEAHYAVAPNTCE